MASGRPHGRTERRPLLGPIIFWPFFAILLLAVISIAVTLA